MLITWMLWLSSALLLLWQAARWWRGLRRLQAGPGPGGPSAGGAISPPEGVDWVLVAARDEAERLPALARALERQTAPLRLVLVDDGSRDGTAELAERLFAHWPGARILRQPATGKLAALQGGLAQILAQASPADRVCFTDADCRPAAGWLAAHRAAHVRGAGLVCGHVRILPEGAAGLSRARRFENTVSSLQCALGCALGNPGYARGGNWSTRAELLRQAGALDGLEHLGSGDDVHLVRRLLRCGARAQFLLDPQAEVETTESVRPLDLRRQARRRYGKLRDLALGERARQLGLFGALAVQLALLALWLPDPRPRLALPLGLLGLLTLAARALLVRGLQLLGEPELAARPLASALGLALHALCHTGLGLLRGYEWKPAPAAFPPDGERERKA
ncbi:MAG: glycosyltransferase [Candidatus Delongbacteria bacterium]